MKKCKECKRNKSLDDFPRDGRATDGRRTNCKTCTNRLHRLNGRSIPAPPFKTCIECKVEKPIADFNKNGWRIDGYQSRCRDCHYPKWRAYQVKREYGISIDEYETMSQAQGGVCAICKRPPKKKALSVDHDHDTGRVRGLLCWPCNRFLGHMKDDTDLLQRMIDYLTFAS